MRATREQIRAVNELLERNPSMIWDGSFGFYSSGQCVIQIYWSFDETQEKFNITFNPDGTQENFKK